jgi:hypothetical protein
MMMYGMAGSPPNFRFDENLGRDEKQVVSVSCAHLLIETSEHCSNTKLYVTIQHELHLWIYYVSKLLNMSEIINTTNSRHMLSGNPNTNPNPNLNLTLI